MFAVGNNEEKKEFCSYISIKKSANFISTLGTVIGILAIIAAIVIAFISFEELWFVSLILVFVGVMTIIMFTILSNIIFGFGDLIEYTKEISEKVSKKSNN